MKNSREKPNIGVTGPDRGGAPAWLFTRFAVWRAGGRARRITPDKPDAGVELDGLIIGGGADIHPEYYGMELNSLTGKEAKEVPDSVRRWFIRIFEIVFYPILFLFRKLFSVSSPVPDRKRDQLELKLIEAALREDIPILGICRGAQLLNIKMGGTLHQEIDGFYGEIPRYHTIWPEKKIRVKRGSLLESILGIRELRVNALHHQAIDRTGSNLEVVAREDNDIIQAVEFSEKKYVLGVQWHPEYMPQKRRQRRLFRRLVETARLSGTV